MRLYPLLFGNNWGQTATLAGRDSAGRFCLNGVDENLMSWVNCGHFAVNFSEERRSHLRGSTLAALLRAIGQERDVAAHSHQERGDAQVDFFFLGPGSDFFF